MGSTTSPAGSILRMIFVGLGLGLGLGLEPEPARTPRC